MSCYRNPKEPNSRECLPCAENEFLDKYAHIEEKCKKKPLNEKASNNIEDQNSMYAANIMHFFSFTKYSFIEAKKP